MELELIPPTPIKLLSYTATAFYWPIDRRSCCVAIFLLGRFIANQINGVVGLTLFLSKEYEEIYYLSFVHHHHHRPMYRVYR
jgi:hypothetical protein